MATPQSEQRSAIGGAMYLGDGKVLMANEADQIVGVYDMNAVGTPVGFSRPY